MLCQLGFNNETKYVGLKWWLLPHTKRKSSRTGIYGTVLCGQYFHWQEWWEIPGARMCLAAAPGPDSQILKLKFGFRSCLWVSGWLPSWHLLMSFAWDHHWLPLAAQKLPKRLCQHHLAGVLSWPSWCFCFDSYVLVRSLHSLLLYN